MRRCVRSRNLVNEEAMTRVGPQRHGGGGQYIQVAYVKNALHDLIFIRVIVDRCVGKAG